jgi:uncharacterized membrane protein
MLGIPLPEGLCSGRQHEGGGMVATIVILLLWLGFAATHIGLSTTALREHLVLRLGENPFRGIYSLIAFAFFVPLIWVYFTHKHAGPRLWTLPTDIPLLFVMYVGMAVAFILVIGSLVRPSPGAVVPGSATPRGVQRITRHPLFMGLALFGLLHLLPNSTTGDIVFFGGFPVFSLIGGWHQDQRKLTGSASYRQFHQSTPFLPFTGTATLQGIREISPAIIVGGVVATIVVRYFHASWFGG